MKGIVVAAAVGLLLAGCGDNPDRVTTLPDGNVVTEENLVEQAPDAGQLPYSATTLNAAEPTPTPTPSPSPTSPMDLLDDEPEPVATPTPVTRAARERAAQLTIRFDCRGGAPSFNARFDRRYGTATMTFVDGEVARLERGGGSGTVYRGDGFELRGRGNAATVTGPDGDVAECSAAN